VKISAVIKDVMLCSLVEICWCIGWFCCLHCAWDQKCRFAVCLFYCFPHHCSCHGIS